MHTKAHRLDYIPVKKKINKESRKLKHFRMSKKYVQTIILENGQIRSIVHYGK